MTNIPQFKVGDTVFVLWEKDISEEKVTQIPSTKTGFMYESNKNWRIYPKRIYATEAEALAAMREGE